MLKVYKKALWNRIPDGRECHYISTWWGISRTTLYLKQAGIAGNTLPSPSNDRYGPRNAFTTFFGGNVFCCERMYQTSMYIVWSQPYISMCVTVMLHVCLPHSSRQNKNCHPSTTQFHRQVFYQCLWPHRQLLYCLQELPILAVKLGTTREKLILFYWLY